VRLSVFEDLKSHCLEMSIDKAAKIVPDGGVGLVQLETSGIRSHFFN
jgi:hypothetical protein